MNFFKSLFSRNHVDLGAASKAIEKGLQYQADVMKIMIDAVDTGDPTKLAEAANVLDQWRDEVVGDDGLVRENLGNAMIIYSLTGKYDPFATSRKMAQELKKKYGN